TQSLATYAALAIVVAAVFRPVRVAGWVAAGVVVLGVGWSRVYLGMHWATDIAVGWLVGAAWLAPISLLVAPARALLAERTRRGAAGVTSPADRGLGTVTRPGRQPT